MAPLYLLSEFGHAHQIHGYKTRSHDLLRPHLAKAGKYQGSFGIKGAPPGNIRQIETLNGVKIKLKRHLRQ